MNTIQPENPYCTSFFRLLELITDLADLINNKYEASKVEVLKETE